MKLTYHGWSGISLNRDDVQIGFDLMNYPSKGKDVVLCVSHGHPDHVGAIHAMSMRQDPQFEARTHVLSSREILRAVANEKNGPRHLHEMQPGDVIKLAGAEFTCFSWQHMSLLPPGLRPKFAYVRSLLSHPFGLARVGLEGLGHPLRAPTLGFGVRFSGGCTVVNYGEGLHRRTNIREVREIAQHFSPQVVLFAVEPEDTEIIPRFLRVLGPETICIYEAHRPWREMFELPCVDLEHYAKVLRKLLPHVSVIPLVELETVVELN